MSKLHRLMLFGLTALGLGAIALPAHAWVGVRIGIGGPYCWGPGYYYYPPPVYAVSPPVYLAPAPVYAVSPPVYVAPRPAVVQSAAPLIDPDLSPAAPPSAQPSANIQTVSANQDQLAIDRYLGLLTDPNDGIRSDAVTNLGQLHAARAIDRLAAVLSGDRSPIVRESAARALAVIGNPKAMSALKYAVQVDPDQFVRHSAQFAIDIITDRPTH